MPEGWQSEVATTTARNHYTWANELRAGETRDNGLLVRRFEVGPRDPARYDELHAAIAQETATYADELEWLANSVWSPGLQRFLEEKCAAYDLALFSPYFFGTTIWGAQVDPERSALVPCLHDEAYARLKTVQRVLESVRGCLFNAPAEERLARRLCRVRQGAVVGMGFDSPEHAPRAEFARPRGLGPYLLYAGRIEEGKRVDVAVEYALRHARERADAPRLVLIGAGTYQPPEEAADVVLHAGFLDEQERRAAHAEALALVNPSHLESLSIVVIESWLEGTPVLVSAGSEVLREHLDASGGGFVFDSYESYRNGVERLLEEPELASRLAAAGRSYALDKYGWPAVRRRFREAVERLTA
jgi:glycosyltransferase involved in cell wall biosynthesis